MNRFVILAVPRSGSNLLCTLLNSHPRILCHHELFNPQGIFTALSHRNTPTHLSLVDRERDPLQFLQEVWRTGEGYACVGFKWTLGQSDLVLDHVAREKSIRKLVLRRRNRVKTYVSEAIAQQTQQWEVYRTEELVLPRPRVTVDPRELMDHMGRVRRFYAKLDQTLRQTNQPFLDVEYEDLASPAEHERILRFLEVDDAQIELSPQSVKQNPTDLRELVANFEQLAAALSGTDLCEELYDRGM